MAHNSTNIETKHQVTVTKEVKSYANSAFVVKKTKAAQETLKKFPVPQEFLK